MDFRIGSATEYADSESPLKADSIGDDHYLRTKGTLQLEESCSEDGDRFHSDRRILDSEIATAAFVL